MRRRRRTPGHTARDGYGWAHQVARRRLLEGDPPCWRCGAPATQADHRPPLELAARALGIPRAEAAGLYSLDPGAPYRLLPACARCNQAGGLEVVRAKQAARRAVLNLSREW